MFGLYASVSVASMPFHSSNCGLIPWATICWKSRTPPASIRLRSAGRTTPNPSFTGTQPPFTENLRNPVSHTANLALSVKKTGKEQGNGSER